MRELYRIVDFPNEITFTPAGECVKWSSGETWFSYTAKPGYYGRIALSIHLYSKEPKTLRAAFDDFISYVKTQYPMCDIILANVNRKSVGVLCLKCGFQKLKTTKDGTIYYKVIKWDS